MLRVVAVALMVVLLAPGSFALASPLCLCDHGAEVPCECPHHAADGVDPASLPPCHRAKKKKRPAGGEQSSFKSKCGSRAPAMEVLPLTVLPRIAGEAPRRAPATVTAFAPAGLSPTAHAREVPKPPPRAG